MPNSLAMDRMREGWIRPPDPVLPLAPGCNIGMGLHPTMSCAPQLCMQLWRSPENVEFIVKKARGMSPMAQLLQLLTSR